VRGDGGGKRWGGGRGELEGIRGRKRGGRRFWVGEGWGTRKEGGVGWRGVWGGTLYDEGGGGGWGRGGRGARGVNKGGRREGLGRGWGGGGGGGGGRGGTEWVEG